MGPLPARDERVTGALIEEPTPPGLMPDLYGLSARDALRTLTRIGLTGRIAGNGVVIEQTPEPGTVLAPGDTSTLTLGRREFQAGGTHP
jgi:beta-lactam-binding protein with PASTA domain